MHAKPDKVRYPTRDRAVPQGATNLGMPRANFQKKVSDFDAGYSIAYIGTKSTNHPKSKETNQGKIVSTGPAEKLAM